MKTLTLITPDNLASVEGFIRPLLIAACKRSDGRYLVDDVLRYLVNGSWFLWIARENGTETGLCIVEIADYPQVRMLRFICATGLHAKDWTIYVTQIEAWGREHGCTTAQIESRMGWQVLMKEHGYKRTHVSLYKALLP